MAGTLSPVPLPGTGVIAAPRCAPTTLPTTFAAFLIE